MSAHMEPPFSHLLDWTTFSARLAPRDLPSLKTFVKSLDHATLLAGVRRATATLTYELDARADAGRDMLPLLVYAMAQAVARPIAAPTRPLRYVADWCASYPRAAIWVARH